MTKQQNQVHKFIASSGHSVAKEGNQWVCRSPKGIVSKHFPPAATKVALYQQMYEKLVELGKIEEDIAQ